MYVIATVICPNFHFSVSPHVPFLNLLFEQIAIPTSIYLQNLASIQPRMSLVMFARSPFTDRPGLEKDLLRAEEEHKTLSYVQERSAAEQKRAVLDQVKRTSELLELSKRLKEAESKLRAVGSESDQDIAFLRAEVASRKFLSWH